jgi:hypothetical protein
MILYILLILSKLNHSRQLIRQGHSLLCILVDKPPRLKPLSGPTCVYSVFNKIWFPILWLT